MLLSLGAIIFFADYDRLHFADKLTQQKHFRSQLALAKKHSLPLFLHSRAAHKDFVRILTEEGFADDGGRKVGARGGVVHSFTGTAEEIQELVWWLTTPSLFCSSNLMTIRLTPV